MQYSPARLQAPREKATLMTAMTKATLGTTAVPLRPKASAGPGVIAARSSMHSAGPRNATPWASFRTRVMENPRSTSESATGPTSGVITTIATYGSRLSAELIVRSILSAPEKYEGSHARRV